MNTKSLKISTNYSKKILLLVMIILTSKICFGDISGRIISKKDNNPIPFAKIEFLPYHQVTLSDENGYFILESKETKGKLKFSSSGYKTKIITITPEISSELLIKLEIEPIEISGISVKGERINSLTYLSRNVEIIEIENSNYRSIPDLLRKETGIRVRSCLSNPKFTSVDIRGFGETAASNTLVFIDGRRVSEIDISGVDWAQIPLSCVEKIEIIKGGASVLYGDNAVGGVINIMTKRGRGKPYIKTSILGGSYSMWNPKIEASGAINNISYLIHGDYYGTKGYRENNSFNAYNCGGNFAKHITNVLEVLISTNYHKDKYGLPGALSESDLSTIRRKSTNFPFDKANTEDFFIKFDGVYNIILERNNWGVLSTSASYRKRKSHADFVSMSGINKNNISTLGITPKFTINKKIMGHKNIFALGLDHYNARDKIYSDGIGFIGPYTKRAEITKKSLGLFLNDDFSILSNLALNIGYRYENVKYQFEQQEDITMSEKRNINEHIVNASISYDQSNNLSLFAKFSQSFRFPAVDEFFSVWTGMNTNLVHQKADEYEIGIKNILLNKMLYFKCSLYRMNITNEIYYNSFTWKNENYEKTRHEGLELEIKYMPLSSISLFANHTYLKSRFKNGNFNKNQIPGVPKNKDILGITIKPTQNLTISIVGNYIGESYFIGDLDNAAKPLMPYIITDTEVELKKGNLSASFGVNNVFNEKYSEYSIIYYTGDPGNFYPSPERNFVGELSYRF